MAMDYGTVCYDEAGAIGGAWLAYVLTSIFLTVVMVVGIPAVMAYQLHKYREPINHDNHDFLSVCHLKPLFVYYRPGCQHWEIYFMVEKVLLVGLGSVLYKYPSEQAILTFGVTIFALCGMCKSMPSRTPEYNNANIFSHVVIVSTSFYAYIRKHQDPDDVDKTDYLQIMLVILQLLMTLMLIYISTTKLKAELHKARAEYEQERSLDKSGERPRTRRRPVRAAHTQGRGQTLWLTVAIPVENPYCSCEQTRKAVNKQRPPRMSEHSEKDAMTPTSNPLTSCRHDASLQEPAPLLESELAPARRRLLLSLDRLSERSERPSNYLTWTGAARCAAGRAVPASTRRPRNGSSCFVAAGGPQIDRAEIAEVMKLMGESLTVEELELVEKKFGGEITFDNFRVLWCAPPVVSLCTGAPSLDRPRGDSVACLQVLRGRLERRHSCRRWGGDSG